MKATIGDRLHGAGLMMLALASAWACAGRSDRNDGRSSTAGASNTAGASPGGAVSSGGTVADAGMSTGGSPSAGFAGTGGSSAGSEPVAGTTSAGATAGAGQGAGSGGTSGAGATTSTGGEDAGSMAGGAGEAASSFPECVTDEDCEIAGDCCSCHAVPKGASVAVCRVACESNGCETQGLPAVAACTLGRCTLAASCEAWRVLCDSLPPTCPTGQTPSVTEDGCWGPCAISTECSGVTDCDACGEAHCVKFPNVGGTTIRCISREAECETGNLCECLSPCGDFGCGEQNGEVSCFCGGC